MIRDLTDPLLDRWLKVHPLMRFIGVIAALSLVAFVAVKPGYRWFKEWRMDRHLEAARQAADETRMHEARDLSLTVLRSGNASIEAFRILEESTAALGDPRHDKVAMALLAHADGTEEDRLKGFLAVKKDAPLSLVGRAWTVLPVEYQARPRFATAFARRLLAENRLGEATRVLLAVPEDSRDDGVRQTLARVLIASRKPEGYEEAQRLIATGLATPGSEVSTWLDVFEELPVSSLRENLLPPADHLADRGEGVDPARIALARARIEYASRLPQGQEIIGRSIREWKDRSPELLARFLSQIGLHQRLLDTYSEQDINACHELLPLLLDAAERLEDWDRVRRLLDACDGHLPKYLELAYRAVLAANTTDAGSPSNAARATIAEALLDSSNRALLALHRFAADRGFDELATTAMVEAIRNRRGALPLYEDQKALCQALAQSGEDMTLLEICSIYLTFEPGNPVLLTQYAYLACLNDVIEPAKLLPSLERLAEAFPGELPIHSTLATVLLCDDQAGKAAAVLEPFELEKEEFSPAIRIVFLTSQVRNGQIPGNDPRIEDFPWDSLMESEKRKFRSLLDEAGPTSRRGP